MSNAMSRESNPTLLVIGYGNELRGDDAVGIRVARAVASWNLPDVGALAVHQLTPELAERLAEADVAIFVDAWHTSADREPRLQFLDAPGETCFDAQISSPRSLFALTRVLYRRSPQAWLMSIPASNFDFGASFSPVTCRGMIVTLRFLRDMVPLLRQQQRRRQVGYSRHVMAAR